MIPAHRALAASETYVKFPLSDCFPEFDDFGDSTPQKSLRQPVYLLAEMAILARAVYFLTHSIIAVLWKEKGNDRRRKLIFSIPSK